MSSKRLLIALAGVAVAALVVVGLLQAGGSPKALGPSRLTPSQVQARLAGSPAPLASLHSQASDMLPGGLPALRARLARLRGRPIVVNKWASWCEPCRSEFGVLQRVSVSLGREVAFLGIDSGDASRKDATDFLRSFPVSYPSYFDHDGEAGQAITGSSFMPVTVFYDRSGRTYIHDGPYPSVAKLERDVRLYALAG